MDTRSITYGSLLLFCLALWCCQQAAPGTHTSISLNKLPASPDLADTASLIKEAPQIEQVPIDFDTSLWSDLAQVDSRLQLDLRYATTNNFVEEQLYDCPRCFMRPEAAIALRKVHEALIAKGYGMKLYDCYRPKSVQERLWQKVPNATYVTPPHKGSMHNRGYAVDVTLVDKDGKELDMGTPFDFFGRKAHHDCYDLDEEVLQRRKLLRTLMAEYGFKHIRTEWWHYSYKGPYKSPFELADFQWSCH